MPVWIKSLPIIVTLPFIVLWQTNVSTTFIIGCYSHPYFHFPIALVYFRNLMHSIKEKKSLDVRLKCSVHKTPSTVPDKRKNKFDCKRQGLILPKRFNEISSLKWFAKFGETLLKIFNNLSGAHLFQLSFISSYIHIEKTRSFYFIIHIEDYPMFEIYKKNLLKEDNLFKSTILQYLSVI